jgi:hypothetical protein
MQIRKNSLVVEDIHNTMVIGSRFVETAGLTNRPRKLPPIESADKSELGSTRARINSNA